MADRAPRQPVDLVEAGILLAAPGHEPARRNVALRIADGRIEDIAEATPGDAGAGLLVMPALANAHDHGRGIATLAYAPDGPLETWLPALAAHPRVDPYAVAVLAFAALARSGCSAVAHLHFPQRFDDLAAEARLVAKAAADVGIRIAFVVPLRDRNRLVLGDNDAFLAGLPDDVRSAVAKHWLGPLPSPQAQVATVEAIAADLDAPGFEVQYGPVAPQWCSDELLRLIAESAERSGRRIHTHLFETAYQRQWCDAAYPGGIVRHLEAVGFLSPRLTAAHGVQLDRADIAVLARNGVTVAVNSSSNLRLRSGIAPVNAFRSQGMRIALGLDGLTLDDDCDALRELRLLHKLHIGSGLEDGLSTAQAFDAALPIGHSVIDSAHPHGRIAVGAPADLLVLDYRKLAPRFSLGGGNEAEIVLARAAAPHVVRLIVGGRLVVDNGTVSGVDEEAIAAHVADAVDKSEAFGGAAALIALQSHIRRYYRGAAHCSGEG